MEISPEPIADSVETTKGLNKLHPFISHKWQKCQAKGRLIVDDFVPKCLIMIIEGRSPEKKMLSFGFCPNALAHFQEVHFWLI